MEGRTYDHMSRKMAKRCRITAEYQTPNMGISSHHYTARCLPDARLHAMKPKPHYSPLIPHAELMEAEPPVPLQNPRTYKREIRNHRTPLIMGDRDILKDFQNGARHFATVAISF